MKNKNYTYTFLILATIVILLLSYISYTNRGGKLENAKELTAKEIKNYEGQDLSSVEDFRENSIKGPQYIDK